MSVITKDSLPVNQITSNISDSLTRVKMSNSSNKALLRSTLALSQRLDEKESVLGNERRKINAEKLAAQEQEQVMVDGGYQQGLSDGFASGFSVGIRKGIEVGSKNLLDRISEIPGVGDLLDSRRRRRMNKGGVVPGYGDQDTVPTMLTPGEFVIKKEVVEKVGVDNLKVVNDMDNKITPMDISEDTDSGTSEILVVNRTNVVTQSVVNNSGGGVVPVPIPIPVGGQNDFISYVKSIS
jgi:hypothetical protein